MHLITNIQTGLLQSMHYIDIMQVVFSKKKSTVQDCGYIHRMFLAKKKDETVRFKPILIYVLQATLHPRGSAEPSQTFPSDVEDKIVCLLITLE